MQVLAIFFLIFFSLLFPNNIKAQVSFQDITSQVGLIEPLKGMMAHGAAWGDVNDDGYPDLFVGTFADRGDSSYTGRGHGSYPEPNKLLINNHGTSFTEVLNSPVRVLNRNSGAAFADFDNDSDLDLIAGSCAVEYDPPCPDNICQEGSHVYKNDGQGNFSDVTAGSGLDFERYFSGRNTFVLDYNGDGLLDILMEEDKVEGNIGSSRLMKNLGNFHFQNVTIASGIGENIYGLGGFVGDINGDTWPDIYFAHIDLMFLNNKDGTFRRKDYNFLPDSVTGTYPNMDWPCGADIGDLNNDGKMDMIIGHHYSSSSGTIRVLLNKGNSANGDPIFQDVTFESGLNPSGRQPHLEIQDLNNDGLMDILAASCSNFVYTNTQISNGIPRFSAPQSSVASCGLGYWPAGPTADYNRDGKLDFFGAEWVSSAASPLLKNTSSTGNYIDVQLKLNSGGNRRGVGATVRIYGQGQAGSPGALLGTRVISISNGYSSGREAIVHFGVPGRTAVDVVVNMPNNGPTYTKVGQPTNQLLTITEGGSSIPGDSDGDGDVDGVDYIVWLNHYGQTNPSGPQEGDFDNDNDVDGVDYIIWLTNYSA